MCNRIEDKNKCNNKYRDFNVVLINARSLKTCNKNGNKLAELESLVYLPKCDVLSVTETWLNCDIKEKI